MAAAEDSKLKNVVIVSEGSGCSEEEDVKETGIDLGSISLDKLSLGPKKKLLVLPLVGFIVHRAYFRRPGTFPRNRIPDFCCGKFQIYKRPFCDEFLKFCFERFKVGLWSSAREYNITGILDNVMGELKSKLLFVWDQEECTDTGFYCLDKKDKPLCLKELKYLWQKKYSNLPWHDGEYSPSNTLLISHPVKALLNPPNTAITPQEYNPENKEDDCLGPDGELRVFLDGLVEAKDVPTYVKDHPYGVPAISPSHSDWDYYSEIISYFRKEEARKAKNEARKAKNLSFFRAVQS